MLFQAFSVFITYPLLALLIGFAFAGLYYLWRRRLIMAAAAAWTLYGLMEAGNRLRITCSGECNIRIDLLAIYPGLALLSLAASVSVVSALFDSRSRTP